MPGPTVGDVLSTQRIWAVVSRVKKAEFPISRFFGFDFGGSNVEQFGGRDFRYDIFDHTRRVAKGRAPGAALATSKPQAVGHVFNIFPRAGEQIPLSDERIFNMRQIGGSADETLSPAAERYITMQEVYLAEKFGNIRELQSAAMLRGAYTYVTDGDDLYHSFSGDDVTVNYQIPDGNLTKLDMLGAGDILTASWATAATDIPGNIFAINKAMKQLTGFGLNHIICKSPIWQNVINNDNVKAQGGSANVVFERIQQDGDSNFTAVLRAIPWLTFHILDHGLELGPDDTFTDMIETNHAVFLPDPSPEWATYLEGSEIVTEGPNGVRAPRMGFHAWAYPEHNPSGWQLCGVHNGIPALTNPNAVANGTVVF